MSGVPLRAVLLASALAMSAPAARAADPVPSPDLAAEADLHFERALEAYRRKDWFAALEHLHQSQRLAPNKAVVFNLARTYERVDRFDTAFRYYADYLEVADDPATRQVAEEAIARLSPSLALVRVESDPPGATIYVDREDLGAVGRTPRTLALTPGDHTVLVRRAGAKPAEAAVTAVVGETAAVAVPLTPILGTVRLSLDADGDVAATVEGDGGELLGTLPLDVQLPPGARVLTVRRPGFRPLTVPVEVLADQVVARAVTLAPLTGSVVVDALERGARIEVDGVVAGFTPAVLDVPVGQHEVVVSLPGFRPYKQTVDVVADGTAAVAATLRSQVEVAAASRARETVEEAPASVSVISAAEIRAFGYQSLYEALSATRGIFPSDDRTYQSFGVRGYGRPGDYGNRNLVTLDGHTLNDDQLGASFVGTDHSADLGDVAQIEVVRGPGSALYGSNAFLGVINVVTKGEEATDGPHALVTASSSRSVRARAGVGWGGAKAGGWVSVAGLAGQGDDLRLPALAAPSGPLDDGVSRDADGTSTVNASAKAWAGAWTVQGWFTGRRKEIATGAFGTLPGDDRNRADDLRGFGEVRFEPVLSDKVRLSARTWVDGTGYRGTFVYEDGTVLSDGWRGVWAGVEPRVIADLTPWLTLTTGAEARGSLVARLTGDVDGVRVLDETPRQQVFAGYLVLDLRGGRWIRATIGGRYDHFTLGGFGGSFNPRTSVVLTPTEDDVIKLVVGTAFRAPSPYELFYNDGGVTQIQATDLTPERILTSELEYTHRFGEVTSLTVSAWYNELTRLVTLEDGEDGLLVFDNSDGRVRAVGGEWEVRRDWRAGWMVAAQQSWQVARAGSLLTGEQVTNVPLQRASLAVAAPVVPTLATLASRFVVGTPRRAWDDSLTPWEVQWDITLTGQIPGLPLSWGLGVRNLLDWKGGSPAGLDVPQPVVPLPGRSVFATLRVGKGS